MSASAVRQPGREHIPLYPKGFIAVRIVQLVFAVLILALTGYSVSILASSGNIFILVVALFTITTSIYHLVAWFGPANAYNYWAVLGLDIFLVVMWLASFALLASETAYLAYYTSSYSYYSYYSYSYSYTSYVFWYTMAAAAGLGGIQFALHIISLVIHSVKLHKHRAAGLHCMPGQAQTLPVAVVAGAVIPPGGVPTEKPYPQAQAAPAGAYPAYPQQPVPVYSQQAPPPPGVMPTPYGGIPQQVPQQYPQQQQQQQQVPQQYYQQGQGQIPLQSTGGSYHYQQGAPVPLFAQTTGGSTLQSQPQQQQQQQQQPQQQQQQPQQQIPQPTQSELANNQVQGQ